MAETAAAKRMALRSDLILFPLDDEIVVFCETSQSLIGLNGTAARIVRALQTGMPAENLPGAIAAEMDANIETASGWLAETLQALAAQGLLAGGGSPVPAIISADAEEGSAHRNAKIPPVESFEPQAEGRYELLGTHAVIRYAHPAQMRSVDFVIGHLKSDRKIAPNLVIEIPCRLWDGGRQLASYVYCNGKPEGLAKRLSHLGPVVKSALWVASVNAHDFLLDLHAGVVGKEGRCILLPAAAGSGKSSLTAALTHSGLDYYSDEVALVERDTFLVSPVPLAVCVKSTGWELMSRYYPEISQLPIHRRDDGKTVRYMPPPAAKMQVAPARVSHIVFPRYCGDEPTRLTPVTRSDALTRLMDQCLALRLRLDPGGVEQLVRWIAGIDCFALTFSSLDEAVSLVRRTAFPQ